MRLENVACAFTIALVAACGPTTRGSGDDAGTDSGGPCVDGTHECDGNNLLTCHNGMFQLDTACPLACDSQLGCVVCAPATGTCNGDTSHYCKADGSGYVDEYCDPVMGSSCDASSGLCVGACSAHSLGTSYIGCDYYATQTSQLVLTTFQFAVAVSNTTGADATVTIDGGTLTSAITLTVPTGQVATQYLPWVPALKTCTSDSHIVECGGVEQWGALAVKGAYHIRSTEPVTVYQFSPLDYTNGSQFSYSNDASLLFPTNAWTGNYFVASSDHWDTGAIGSNEGVFPSLMAVTAFQDGTMVTVNPKANTMGGNGAPSFSANSPQTISLNQGDVLQLLSADGDLTGSTVSSDKPVEVVAGHHCTQMPLGYTACDHIEETMFPTEALSTKYLVTAPYLPSINGPREEMVRIVATEAGTTVTLDPAIGGPYTLNNAGDYQLIPQQVADFLVTANHKVLVAQYMESQDAPPGAGTGDPSESLAVPVDQYRTIYQFHAPTNYDGGNFVNITAPVGATVTLDGVDVPAGNFTAIGGSGYAVARMTLSNAGNGTHTAQSSMPFGIQVYGYGSYTSYMYPGGLDLMNIPIP